MGIIFALNSGKETRKDMNKAINNIESINNAVQKKAEAIKDSSAHTTQKICNVIKEVNGKTKGVKKDIKDGYNEIKQDIHKTAKNISKELK